MLALVGVGCGWVPGRDTGPERPAGTCAGACAHYVECRPGGDPSGEIRRACVSECELVFVEDGVEDEYSLGLFENLACEDAVSFIEGDDGRPAGASPPDLKGRERPSR